MVNIEIMRQGVRPVKCAGGDARGRDYFATKKWNVLDKMRMNHIDVFI